MWPIYHHVYRNLAKIFKFTGDPVIHLATFQKLELTLDEIVQGKFPASLGDTIDLIHGLLLVKKYSND